MACQVSAFGLAGWERKLHICVALFADYLDDDDDNDGIPDSQDNDDDGDGIPDDQEDSDGDGVPG